MKAFKKLKQIILDNLSLKDFFMSDVFRNHLTGIVKMVSGRYGNEEMFVKTRWGGEDIAYTDNRTVFVNLNNQIIEGVNDPEERYLCLLGFLGHELGHVLYTDFDSSEDFCLGKKGKYLGLNDKEKKIADEISDYRAKGFTEAIAEITHRICNSIEDGFVNRKISETFPGTFKQGIKKLHSIQFKEELKSVGNPLTDAINAILSLSLGYPIPNSMKKSVDCSDALEEILKGVNKAETPSDRMGLANRCLTVVWKYLKPILDIAEQMADSQSGNSRNGNDGKGQQSGSSSQDSSGSSQGSSGQASQNQSSNDGCGTSAVSKILKQAPQNSQTGKGKGILNRRTQNSSSQGLNTKNSQDETGGQQNNHQKASSQNDKSKDTDSDSSKDDFVSGSQNNISEDKEKAENQNNTSGNKDNSNQNELSEEKEGSANSSDKSNESSDKSATIGDKEDSVENDNLSDNKEDDKQDEKNSIDGESSDNSSNTEETELSPEDENTSDYGDNGYNSETEDNNFDNTQDFGGDSFDEKTTFTDMPETPSDATFDGQTGTGEQDIKSALEGLLSQYAKRYAEQNPEKVEKLMLEANAKEIASGKNSPHNGYPFIINNVKGSNNYRYDLASKRLSGISKRLQKRVEQVLEDQNDGGVCKNLLMGNKINPAASASSHGKIFKRNILPDSKDIAISVLIDESGSMSGNRIEKALEMAIIIEDFCAGLNIPLSIVGHCDSCNRVHLRNYIRFEDINKNRKYNLAEMRAGGCNRDGFALSYCVKNLLEREEENKLMIIISDGRPNSTKYSGASAEKDLRSIKTEFERKGGRLIAAAIGDDRDTIKRIYGNSFLDVTDINNLPLKMASIISRYVQN